VRNGHGYVVDREYDNLLKYDYAQGKQNALPWRHAMLAFLVDLYPGIRKHGSVLKSIVSYENGETNVAPLDYRLQFSFEGEEGLEEMRKLQQLIEDERVKGNPLAVRIATVDESHPHEDPAKSTYTLYLVPWGAQKERMLNWVVGRLAAASGRDSTRDLRVFYAGDTLTDLRAGLYGGGEADTTFLLATGSRVAPYILNRRGTFGGERLDFLWSSDNRPTDRLRSTGGKGIYTFSVGGGVKKPNRVVIGDERYPGLTAPGSVHAFLKEFL
jgi:hypothetical protein